MRRAELRRFKIVGLTGTKHAGRLSKSFVKSCAYCGRDNDDAAVFCARCGSNEWKELTTPRPISSNPAVQPDAAPPELGITTGGSITSIPCRTLREAALVAEHLEQADILPLLSPEPSEEDPHDLVADFPLRVHVSAKALAAEQGLSESLNFRPDVSFAQQPLRLVMKLFALGLPALFLVGWLMYLREAQGFKEQGFTRRLREWSRWFLFGWVLLAAAVFIVILLAQA